MGILKLGSLYKKSKSKKDSPPPSIPIPDSRELHSLELSLNLSNTNSSYTSRTIESYEPTPSTVYRNEPAGTGSLFDDIFAELGTKPNNDTSNHINYNNINNNNNRSSYGNTPKKNQSQWGNDDFNSDISLALALSQQLRLEEDNLRNTGTPKNNAASSQGNNSNKKEVSDFLFKDDSIYSSYLRGISTLDNDTNKTTHDDYSSSSMFASLMTNSSSNSKTPTYSNSSKSINQPATSSTTTTAISNPTLAPPTTQIVLDSDISDSDDSRISDISDIDDDNGVISKDGHPRRMTKGARPIMERRTQDRRASSHRKGIWSNKADSEASRIENSESMIERMKDRHRNQVKLAALRQQEMFGMNGNNSMPTIPPQQMVSQPYGMMPQHPVVLQHPGMMMNTGQIYYPATPNDPSAPMPLPTGMAPYPEHSLSSPSPHYYGQKPAVNHPEMDHPVPNMRVPANLSESTSSKTDISQDYNNKSNTSLAQQSDHSDHHSHRASTPNVSPKHSKVSSDTDLSSLPEQEKPKSASPVPLVEDDGATEADCEHTGDEEEVIVPVIHKKRSDRKLRTKTSQENGVLSDSNRQMKVSRSTPSSTRKKSKKSPKSSRRNSQDHTPPPFSTSTPTNNNAVPPLDLPPSVPTNVPFKSNEDHHNHHPQPQYQPHHTAVPRSNSQTHLAYQHHPQPIRHMKSEPELPRHRKSEFNHPPPTSMTPPQAFYQQQQQQQQQQQHQQQQQLRYEWEMMQAHNRDQHGKKQHKQQHKQHQPQQQQKHQSQQLPQQQQHSQQHPQQQGMPYVQMYSPMYYSSGTPTNMSPISPMTPSMVPYNPGMVDPSMYNQQQPQQQQTYPLLKDPRGPMNTYNAHKHSSYR
ncbi:hypothetical protein BDB01DRAFT_846482 [Pilobolus umbonatus]|nr:hypothetical protein BDB01DRAFT_846482 [Pilobolus umbonatus]